MERRCLTRRVSPCIVDAVPMARRAEGSLARVRYSGRRVKTVCPFGVALYFDNRGQHRARVNCCRPDTTHPSRA